MANDAHNHEMRTVRGSVDWKTYGMGITSLCVILGGALFSQWNHSSQSDSKSVRAELETLRESNREQWRQINANRSELLKLESGHERIKEMTLDQEQRIRDNEKLINRWSKLYK